MKDKIKQLLKMIQLFVNTKQNNNTSFIEVHLFSNCGFIVFFGLFLFFGYFIQFQFFVFGFRFSGFNFTVSSVRFDSKFASFLVWAKINPKTEYSSQLKHVQLIAKRREFNINSPFCQAKSGTESYFESLISMTNINLNS